MTSELGPALLILTVCFFLSSCFSGVSILLLNRGVREMKRRIDNLEKEREQDKERITRMANMILGARIQMSDRKHEELTKLRNEVRGWDK